MRGGGIGAVCVPQQNLVALTIILSDPPMALK